jgi:hypothetical protein
MHVLPPSRQFVGVGGVQRTDAARGVRIACASAALPDVARWTVHKVVMRVPDLVEKVDAFRAREERRAHCMHVRVAPSL